MNRYVCPVCGGVSYSAASPDTLKDNKCLDPACAGRVVLVKEGEGATMESEAADER